MELPRALIAIDCAYAFDGGSIAIELHDDVDAPHHLTLWQHTFLENLKADRLPGRLYFDGQAIPVRSDAERRLLQLLRDATIEATPAPDGQAVLPAAIVLCSDIDEFREAASDSPGAAIALVLQRVTDFVSSEEYVLIARYTDDPDGGIVVEAEAMARERACVDCRDTFRLAGPLSPALRAELAVLLREGKPVVAIKLIRERTRSSLRDAKSTFEHLVFDPGRCHQCRSPLRGGDYEDCWRCGALNIRVHDAR